MIIKRRQKEFGIASSFLAKPTFNNAQNLWQQGEKMKAIGQGALGVGKVATNTALAGGGLLAGTTALATSGMDNND